MLKVVVFFVVLMVIVVVTHRTLFTCWSGFSPVPSTRCHGIPKVIYITYKTVDAIPVRVIDKLQRMNPAYTIRTFGNSECAEFLRMYWSVAHAAFFDSIKDGPIKADFWRACVVYTFGGVYLDADVDLLQPLDSLLQPNVELCTPASMNKKHVNPILLAAKPGSSIVKRCVDLMFNMRHEKYSYWEYSICKHLCAALREVFPVIPNKSGIYTSGNTRVQILRENPWRFKKDAKTSWLGRVVMNNHASDTGYRKHAFIESPI